MFLFLITRGRTGAAAIDYLIPMIVDDRLFQDPFAVLGIGSAQAISPCEIFLCVTMICLCGNALPWIMTDHGDACVLESEIDPHLGYGDDDGGDGGDGGLIAPDLHLVYENASSPYPTVQEPVRFLPSSLQ